MAYINDTLPIDNRAHPAENDMTEITEKEDTVYAKAFQKCLDDLANEVYGIHDPFDISQRALQTVCEYYDADWCGIFDTDMMLDLWMPFWWYNRLTGDMTPTQLHKGEAVVGFEMFRKMIEDNTAHYQPDIESIKYSKPEVYAFFSKQNTKSFLSVPYSRRESGVIFLRNPKRFGNRPEFLRIIANILAQEINEQKYLDRMKTSVASVGISEDTDVIVNLFGGIEMITKQGKLVEVEMKSAVCSKLFVFMMLNRNRAMPTRVLCDTIWGERDYENPTNNLRSTLYRLRNMFDLISDKKLIVTQPNGYQINPDLKIHTDYEQFDKLYQSVKDFLPKHKQIENLKEVFKLYNGKLFPNGDGEHWHISHSTKYRMMYLNALEKLMTLLNEIKDYNALHDYSLNAINIEPNSPVVIYWLVVSLRKNGAIEMAKRHLESAKGRLLEEEYRDLERRLDIVV